MYIINDKWSKIKTNKPRTSTITIHRYSAIGEMYNAFKLGNIDIICTKMGNYSDYVGTMGYSRKEYIGRNFDFLSLNCNDSILSDINNYVHPFYTYENIVIMTNNYVTEALNLKSYKNLKKIQLFLLINGLSIRTKLSFVKCFFTLLL